MHTGKRVLNFIHLSKDAKEKEKALAKLDKEAGKIKGAKVVVESHGRTASIVLDPEKSGQ